MEKSTYDNYEIIIVENNSTTDAIAEYYSRLLGYDYKQAMQTAGVCGGSGWEDAASGGNRDRSAGVEKPAGSGRIVEHMVGDGFLRSEDRKVVIARYQGAFNYSAINNLGVKYASGEYILLLNNDTEVITVNWMEELLMYAQRRDVGAVGAKLYYADKTIQHAGVVIGLGAHRTAGHVHYKQHRQNLGYMGRLCYAQDMTAVTGACLMVKKSLYIAVGGLDENFAVSLNDVDFCLKLRERGLLNIFTPFAELFHYESASRGLDTDGERAQRYNRESEAFREKWKAELEAGDPYFNPNFSLDRSDFSLKVSD